MNKTPAAPDWLLESRRLRFRRLTPADFGALQEMMADPQVMAAWGHAFSDAQIERWLQNQLESYRQNGVGHFAAIDKETGAMVGQMGLHRCPPEHQPPFPDYEICYILGRRHWHRGYAREGVLALVDYAFGTLGQQEVCAQIKTNNAPSIAVAEVTGFTRRGVFLKHYHGEDMEHYLYVKNRSGTQDE